MDRIAPISPRSRAEPPPPRQRVEPRRRDHEDEEEEARRRRRAEAHAADGSIEREDPGPDGHIDVRV